MQLWAVCIISQHRVLACDEGKTKSKKKDTICLMARSAMRTNKSDMGEAGKVGRSLFVTLGEGCLTRLNWSRDLKLGG